MAHNDTRLGRADCPAGVHISLSTPRPDGDRTQNEYIDTPFRPGRWTRVYASENGKPSKGIKRADIVTAQPKKDREEDEHINPEDSIICNDCGRCKCEACRRPKPLPSTWLCANKCLCSADSVVDYVSCMCCVKAMFYHCSREEEGCADAACSCSGPDRCWRWGWLGALSLVLPCLCCYWPLRASAHSLQTCYSRYHHRGCTCTQSSN